MEPAGRSSMGGRSRAWLAPLLVVAACALFAFRGPLGGRLFYLRDIVQNHLPMRHLVAERMRAWELPLWDPYHGGGTPLLANPDNLVMHPVSLLFLGLPFHAAFTASIVLQFALLMVGGYLLARRTGAARQGAALAAVILGLSGPAASLASMHNVLSAAAWVPLGLWALLAGLEKRDAKLLVLAAACLAVILVAAEPASLLAFVLLAPALAATGPGGGRPFARDLLPRLLAVGGLAVLLASMQILPARALLAIATRGAGLGAGEGLKWSLQPGRLLELVVPRLYGNPTRLSPEAWWGRWAFEGGYPFLLSAYLGPFALACALMGLWRGRIDPWRRRALGIIAAAGLLLALGRHALVYRWLFATVPLVGQIRYPERFLIVTLFALGLLAAHGLTVPEDRGAAGRRAVGWLAAFAGVLFAAASVLAVAPSAADRLLAALASVPRPLMQGGPGPVVRGQLLLSALWAFGEAAALAAAALVLWRASSGRLRAGAAWGAVALAGLSMSVAAAPALSTAAAGWIDDPSPLRAILPSGPNAPRIHHAPRPERLSIWGTTDEVIWGYRFDRFTYALTTGHADRVPSILDQATDRMDLAAHTALLHALPALPLGDRLKILSLAGAGTLLTYDPLDDHALQAGPVLEGFSAPPLRVFRLTSTLPRARIVAGARRPAHPGSWAASLADPEYDPRRMVLLESVTPDASPPPAGGGAAGDARFVEDRPEFQRIVVRAAIPGYLVVADAWAPGWRAGLDGAAVPLLRADGLFRAVPVPAGDHEVTLRYRAPGLAPGLLLSGAGLVLSIAWCIAGRPRPRHAAAPR